MRFRSAMRRAYAGQSLNAVIPAGPRASTSSGWVRLRSVPHESKRESGVSISSLVPMQPVRSMPARVEFYEKLGFVLAVRRDDWGWARLRCGDCRVMLDQELTLPAGFPRIAELHPSVVVVVVFHRHTPPKGQF